MHEKREGIYRIGRMGPVEVWVHDDGQWWYGSGIYENYDAGPMPDSWWPDLKWVGQLKSAPDLFLNPDEKTYQELWKQGHIEYFVCPACGARLRRHHLDNQFAPSIYCPKCDTPGLKRVIKAPGQTLDEAIAASP